MRSAPTDDLGRAVETINSWDTLDPHPEQIPDLDILGRFLRWIGRVDLRELLREGDLPRFRALRTELRAAFDAPDPATALDRLNEILAAWPSVIRAERATTGALVYHYTAASGDPIGSLAVSSAMALVAAVGELGLARFGICAGSPCTCVFVDRTRNRRRRYCSDQCNDRVAQVAHRRRAAAR
jgi:predicted RNA-binding Zn ribbon-like protein